MAHHLNCGLRKHTEYNTLLTWSIQSSQFWYSLLIMVILSVLTVIVCISIHLYCNIEKLVLWSRSEIAGSACNTFKEWWRIGVLEWWSIAHELNTSEILDALCLKLQKIGAGCSFFQYSITPTLQKYVEQSRVMKSPLSEDYKKPGPLNPDFYNYH